MPTIIKISKISVILCVFGMLLTQPAFAQDVTPPLTTYTQTPSSPDGKNSWYKTPVQFNIQSTDIESGVKEINYRLDEGLWQKVSFSGSLNLAPNPSFEIIGATTTGLESWESTYSGTKGTFARDTSNYVTGFESSSAEITGTTGSYNAINHIDEYAVAVPFANMSATGWIKTNSVTEDARIKVYGVYEDALNNKTVQLLAESAPISGTTNWTRYNLQFFVNMNPISGVFLEIGLNGTGSVYVDAVTLDNSAQTASTTITIATDGSSKKIEFYAVDNANNAESYSCTFPIKNCVTFKLDATPPGQWENSGAFRGFFGPAYALWVYTTVKDATSGISTFTDKYQYFTELNPTFGKFSNILSCDSTWRENQWVGLISPPFFPGVKSAYLLTPKTSFCNTNWRACKIVRFSAEDLAGNISRKDLCINGPWIKFRGSAAIRSETYIDMLSEPEGDNTDGVIEIAQNNIDFFTSSKGWKVLNSSPKQTRDYAKFSSKINSKTNFSGNLPTSTGTYIHNGDLTISSSNLPASYATNNFNQIVFVDGNLTIESNIETSDLTAALFIVSGDVNIEKTVTLIEIGIYADGDFYTAYNITEGEDTPTLELRGIYSASKFYFQRTLQGTNNDDTPSEDFTYMPKFLINLKDFFGEYFVVWNPGEKIE